MAENNTQVTVEQPTQQTELSALEKARMADTRQPITLNAFQAYDELEQFGNKPGEYRDGGSMEGNFWRFKFRGAICTVTPEFKEAFDKGALLSVTASPTVFEQVRPDPNNEGKMIKQIGYGWSLSFTDAEKKKKAVNAMRVANEIQALVEAQEVHSKAKLEAIKKADIKVTLTQQEIDQMLAAL